MSRPPAHTGLRHVALYIERLDDCLKFYTELLGMTVEWQPDSDNIYLSSGHDNLALHRATQPVARDHQQVLDHLGFILARADDVNQWHDFLVQHAVEIVRPVKDHRDGARSFYCRDPDGNVVQMIYHPPLA